MEVVIALLITLNVLLCFALRELRRMTKEQEVVRLAIEHLHRVWFEYGPRGSHG